MKYLPHFYGLAFALASFSQPVLAQDKQAETVKTQRVNSASLTLEQVISLGLEKSPVLQASSSRRQAAIAARDQASALPNPDISIEAENIFGGGAYEGTDAGEITYGVSQLIEMPGKRGNRMSVADAEAKKAVLDYTGQQLDLIQDINVAYAAAASSELRLRILEDEMDLATKILASVAAKVEAGKEPAIQKNKAQIELSSSRVALERAQREAKARIYTLARLVGIDGQDIEVLPDSLPQIVAPEALEYYQERLAYSPDIKAVAADVERAQSNLSFEKASAVPDPTLNVGVRDFREDGEQAFVAGVSFPFPVFNMNRAGIKRAGHQLNAAKLDQQGAVLSGEAALVDAYAEFSNAFSELVTLKESILPGAEEAFAFARTGYDAGKFNFLEVLDAQRTLFEVRKQLNDATLSYFTQRAVIERMAAINHPNSVTKKEK